MDLPWLSRVVCVCVATGSGGNGADVTAVDVVTAGPMVLARCGG